MRCFLAITPPEEILDAIADLQEDLPGANWQPPENLHLTLLFLGEQPRRALEDLDAMLGAVKAAPFELQLKGVGAFGGRDARLVYAEVAESAALRALQARLEQIARDLDMEIETRRFKPHVTLARWGRGAVTSEKLGRYVAKHGLFESEPFQAESFGLHRSDLGKSGAVYTEMARYPLETPRP